MKLRSSRVLPDPPPFDALSDTSSETEDLDALLSDEESDVYLVDKFEDIDVEQLCQVSISKQREVLEWIRYKEASRRLEERDVTSESPERFSQMNIRGFLKEARIENEINTARSRFVAGCLDAPMSQIQSRRIATDANKRFFFERDPEVMDAARRQSEAAAYQPKPAEATLKRMLLGETIVEACERLKRERKAETAPSIPIDNAEHNGERCGPKRTRN